MIEAAAADLPDGRALAGHAYSGRTVLESELQDSLDLPVAAEAGIYGAIPGIISLEVAQEPQSKKRAYERTKPGKYLNSIPS